MQQTSSLALVKFTLSTPFKKSFQKYCNWKLRIKLSDDKCAANNDNGKDKQSFYMISIKQTTGKQEDMRLT